MKQCPCMNCDLYYACTNPCDRWQMWDRIGEEGEFDTDYDGSGWLADTPG